MSMQNLKFVAIPVPEIIGVPKKFAYSLDTPTLHFLHFFHGLSFGWTLLLFWPNSKFVALPVPGIIVIGVLGGVRTPILGKGRPCGVGDGAIRKSVGEFL